MPENNYGFGTSNISQNIQNVTNRLNNSNADGGLNDYQRAMLNVAQAAAKGSYMSGVSDGSDSGATPNNNVQQLRMPAGSEQQITMPSYELQQGIAARQVEAEQSGWNNMLNTWGKTNELISALKK